MEAFYENTYGVTIDSSWLEVHQQKSGVKNTKLIQKDWHLIMFPPVLFGKNSRKEWMRVGGKTGFCILIFIDTLIISYTILTARNCGAVDSS